MGFQHYRRFFMQETGVELVFILDRSASMFGLEEVTVEHFNSMIEKQKKMSWRMCCNNSIIRYSL